jgi:hypothetical protein
MLNIYDQTFKVSIPPPAHPTCRHSHSSEEDLAGIMLSDADPESDEDIMFVSFWLAPSPSGSRMAISLHDASEDSAINISESKLESDVDLEEVTVSLFHLFYIFLSFPIDKTARHRADSPCQC